MLAPRPRVELEMVMLLTEEATESVGNFTFTVRAAEPTPESQARWNERVNAMANLLLALWEEQQEQPQRDQLAAIAARN